MPKITDDGLATASALTPRGEGAADFAFAWRAV